MGLEPIKELGLQKPKLKQTAKNIILLFLGLAIISIIFSIILSQLFPSDLNSVYTIKQAIISNIPLLAWLLIVRVIGEEIFFRAFLVPRTGIFWSSALFGLMHIGYGSIIAVLGAFAMGLLLAYTFKKTSSLYPNIIAHILYNLFALVI